MVGRLGPISIAAVGMGTAIRFLVMTMMLSVSTGAMSLMAQAKGARDPERMSFVTRQAISSGVLLSLVLMVAGYALAHPLMSLVNSGGDPEAVVLGTRYLRIAFLGPEGTFTQTAAMKHFGHSVETLPQADIDTVFREVDAGDFVRRYPTLAVVLAVQFGRTEQTASSTVQSTL